MANHLTVKIPKHLQRPGPQRQAVDHRGRHVSSDWRIQIDAVCRMIVIHIMHHADMSHGLIALSPGMSWVIHVTRHVMHHADMSHGLTALSPGMSWVIHVMRHVVHHVDMPHSLTVLSPGMSWVAVIPVSYTHLTLPTIR